MEIEELPSRTTDGDIMIDELRIQRLPLFGIPNIANSTFILLYY
jgi:hypothetical protein